MTKSVVLASVVALGVAFGAASPVFAEEVTFTTSGTFSASGTNVFNGTGASSVTFTGNPSGDDNPSLPGGPAADATVDTLGAFSIIEPAGTKIVASGTFLLAIDQTVPAGAADYGPSGFSGTLSAVPGNKTGSLIVTFDKTSVTIAGVTYTLEDLGQNGLAADQLAIGKNGAAIQAAITSPLPEPTFFALTGMGFFGLAVAAARRYKKNESVPTV